MLRLDPELMPGDRRIAAEDDDVWSPRISAEADVELAQRLQPSPPGTGCARNASEA